MVHSNPFSTTTSPLPVFYRRPRSMSTFSSLRAGPSSYPHSVSNHILAYLRYLPATIGHFVLPPLRPASRFHPRVPQSTPTLFATKSSHTLASRSYLNSSPPDFVKIPTFTFSDPFSCPRTHPRAKRWLNAQGGHASRAWRGWHRCRCRHWYHQHRLRSNLLCEKLGQRAWN